MPRILRHEVAARVFARAIKAGAQRLSLARVRWDISGDCQSPVEQLLYGRPDGKEFVYQGGRGPLIIDLIVKCRRCDHCLQKRSAHWRLRALAEWRAAELRGCRTWMVTMTFTPQAQFYFLSLARRGLDAQGVDFDRLPVDEQFRELNRHAGKEVTLALKRLRKGGAGYGPAECRYLLVAEAHKSGLPHYHALIHETNPERPVRHAAIKRCWRAGFLDARLVDDSQQATYATKYLSKSALARVRASSGYGKHALSVAQ